MKAIKLSIWAKENGYSYRGAYEMFIRNQLPDAYKIPSGAIMVKTNIISKSETIVEYTAIYARVSTPKQKDDLTRQVTYIEEFCIANGWVIDKIYKEVASGLNDNRQKLNQLMDNQLITRVVISDKDRITRFGFNYIKKLLEIRNCEIVIINNAVCDQDDLINDFVSVITSMAARVYGLRRHKKHVEHILNNLND
jgi:predicted site-specific integrase-resolvase